MQNSQTPVEDNFDDNEIGLKESPVNNKILINYIKTIAYNFVRDNKHKIWRQSKSDSYGNTKTANGTQSFDLPIATFFDGGGTGSIVLQPNELRRAFVIVNAIQINNRKEGPLEIHYGINSQAPQIMLPPGYALKDTAWSGAVFIKGLVSNTEFWVYDYS